jgi:hypothetical protein
MDDFDRCVEYSYHNKGIYSITCSKGLWKVEGSNKMEVYGEALHYFEQYRDDGEYYDIIGGPSPVDALIKLEENQ